MFYNLVEFAQLRFLILVELLHNQLLSAYTIAHLFLEFLKGCLHPVTVVLSRLYFALLKLPPAVTPDLSHLEVRIHLNHLQLLLLLGRQVVSSKAHPVQY